MITPSKSDTSKNTYTFTGYWIDTLGNKYYVDGLENADPTAQNFNNVIPTSNMTFYPEFIEEVKKHELKFFDYNGNVILQNGKETFGVPYGSTYREANGPLTNFYYLDSSDLLDDERYGFVCWTTAKYKVGEGKNVTPFDLENSVVEKALNLYPYYVKENVREVPSNLEYFNVNKQTGVISLNSIYKNTFKGKLTIPDIEGISKISSFESIDGLTHVYFEKGGPKYTIVQMATFFNCNNLTTVELPESITELGNQSFYSCDNLTTINLNDNITRIGSQAFEGDANLTINKLPDKLKTLGEAAFKGCSKITFSTLPSTLEGISTQCFEGCTNIGFTEFGSNDGSSALSYINQRALRNAGNSNENLVSEITIYNSVNSIGFNAFQGYGVNKGSKLTVYFTKDIEDDYNTTPSELGFATDIDLVEGYTP